MNGVYQIYKRNSVTGQRDTLIQRYTSFELTLNWGTVSKFDIKGETIGSVDLASGDGVLFYRNNELLLSGVVEDVVVKCDTVANKKKTWTATGKDDSVIFSYRQILPDPLNLTFNENISDVTGAPDPETSEYGDDAYAYNRIIHYIYNNLGEGTTAERQISGP